MTSAKPPRERLNRPLAVIATLVGLGLIVLGLYLEDFTASAYSGLWIELGAAIFLVVILFLLERRLVARSQRTAAETARTVAEEATAVLTDRVVRLEDLGRVETQHREERARSAEMKREALKADGVTTEGVRDLLDRAAEANLFDFRSGFTVRTADDPECEILGINPTSEVLILTLGSTTVIWADEPVDEIATQLSDSVERSGVAPDLFSFAYALERLIRSEEVMQQARAAKTGDPARLNGRLRIAINDDWALTSWGLESINDNRGFKAIGGQVFNVFDQATTAKMLAIDVPADVRESAEGTLREALDWVRSRERIGLDKKPHEIGQTAAEIEQLRRRHGSG